MTTLAAVLDDIAYLADHWPDLAEARIPGTERPWRQSDLTAERRAELDLAARVERLERAAIAPGETASPAHDDVLDVILELGVAVDQLAEYAWDRALRPQPPGPWRLARYLQHDRSRTWRHASSAYADPRRNLAILADALLWVDDPDLTRHAGDKLAPHVHAVTTTLRLIRDGQRLDAPCPWCHGPRALVLVELLADEWAIVCRSPVACEPAERDCGLWVRGRPGWRSWEFDWLANRVARTQPAPARPDRGREWGRVREAYERAARDRWDRSA